VIQYVDSLHKMQRQAKDVMEDAGRALEGQIEGASVGTGDEVSIERRRQLG
jgi:hypothetical protein